MAGTDLRDVPWRCGREAERTVYAVVHSEDSDDDILIGVMDTPELAAEVVIAHNCTRSGFWPDG